ncbi:hypothetical protein LJC45_05195 [Alistipes sp. OttesenSCG-928-B03]|nr:hypothetical protein [Alistipes sp. OttesenSCG-928-B03]
MKNIQILAIATFVAAAFGACSSDPLFPDPGFDMLTDKEVIIYRDTAENYTVSLNVKAPGGTDFIQILDARNYEVLDELTEYRGRKDYVFNYTFDFSGVDKQRDSMLLYTVRIVTQDNRAYNSTYSIDLRKMSRPEILFTSNDIVGTTVPVVGIRALIKTGIYKISSIRILINGEERYKVPAAELQEGLKEYPLIADVGYNFEVGNDYPVSVEVTDERGETRSGNLTVKGIQMKQCIGMRVVRDGASWGYYTINYDENGRITKIVFERTDRSQYDSDYTLHFTYGDNDIVTQAAYEYHDSPYLPYILQLDFTYDGDGNANKMTHRVYLRDGGDLAATYETLQNFKFRTDGTIKSFDIGLTTVEEIQYADGFFEGEKIFAEKWMGQLNSIDLSRRRMKTGFVPILNPVHIKGMPPIWCPRWIDVEVPDLFWHKYVYTGDKRGYNNTEPDSNYIMQCFYTTGPDGQLASFRRRTENYDNYMSYTYYYEYAE